MLPAECIHPLPGSFSFSFSCSQTVETNPTLLLLLLVCFLIKPFFFPPYSAVPRFLTRIHTSSLLFLPLTNFALPCHTYPFITNSLTSSGLLVPYFVCSSASVVFCSHAQAHSHVFVSPDWGLPVENVKQQITLIWVVGQTTTKAYFLFRHFFPTLSLAELSLKTQTWIVYCIVFPCLSW